jgi:hypothetical protein
MKSIFVESYRPVLDEVAKRSIRTSQIEVLDFTPPPGQKPTIGLPGSILLYVCRKGSPFLNLLRGAKTKEGAEKFLAAVKQQLDKLKPTTVEQNVSAMVSSDVFAELRHGGETMVETLFVPPETEFIFHFFAYNGGHLAKEGFTLVERLKDNTSAALEAVIVKITPQLTDAEKAALDLVPPSQWSRSTADPGCGDSGTAVTVALAAVALSITISITCLCAVPDVHSIPREELDRLGPTASARKLLELRRAAITKK